jgi:uncharacterized protein (TIGR03067 family)
MFSGLVLAAACSAADDKKDVPKDLVPFQGSWKVVKAEIGGMPPPGGVPPEARFIFEGSKLTVKEGKPNPDVGSYSVDSKKDPTEIDLISPKSEKILGIYKFDKDGKMSIAFTKDPKASRPKKFDDKEAIVLVLEKVKE